ncbi:hypothetical protein BDP27DRAFT_1408410 [Rhodocollybia butyracea]|uniref:Uncharacterized protein n=1 Tax=Rhodocollybia butyracea TaxID=206335 RepID=A0A9P5TX11_9AGAR|nr:hypothetical protein BDP27DRAFT_1408410 [Rhodocollybia butyracea]
MTPAEQKQIFDFGAACYINVVGIAIDKIAYGSSLLGILIAIWLLEVKTWREPKTIQLLCCMIIVLTATGLVIIVGFISFTQAKLGIVEILVGDFVICWRAWVLLPHDKWWRFVLATIVIVNIGVNIVAGIFDTFVVDEELNDATIVLDWVGIAFSLLVNMTATALIGWKAWAHYCTMREASVWSKSRVQKILLLFVESGAFFLIPQMLALIGEILPSVESVDINSNLTISLVSAISEDLWVAFAGLYPIAIIILIHSDNSPIEESFHLPTQLPNISIT